MRERTGELPEGTVPWFHSFARWIGSWLHTPFYRVRVHGVDRVPRTGAVLLVANHSSMLEPQLIFGRIPRSAVFLVKQEMFGGVKGRLLTAIGQLSIRRGEADRKPLLAAVGVLRAGGVVGVFPEGTRGDGDVLNAEQGVAWLARSSEALVLPVACRGSKRPAGSGRRFRPVVDLLIGEPFGLEVGRGRSGLATATEEIRTALARLVSELDEMRAGRSAGARGENI